MLHKIKLKSKLLQKQQKSNLIILLKKLHISGVFQTVDKGDFLGDFPSPRTLVQGLALDLWSWGVTLAYLVQRTTNKYIFVLSHKV